MARCSWPCTRADLLGMTKRGPLGPAGHFASGVHWLPLGSPCLGLLALELVFISCNWDSEAPGLVVWPGRLGISDRLVLREHSCNILVLPRGTHCHRPAISFFLLFNMVQSSPLGLLHWFQGTAKPGDLLSSGHLWLKPFPEAKPKKNLASLSHAHLKPPLKDQAVPDKSSSRC